MIIHPTASSNILGVDFIRLFNRINLNSQRKQDNFPTSIFIRSYKRGTAENHTLALASLSSDAVSLIMSLKILPLMKFNKNCWLQYQRNLIPAQSLERKNPPFDSLLNRYCKIDKPILKTSENLPGNEFCLKVL